MINKLTDDFAVSAQIAPEDVSALAAEGFRAIVCNRPDGEAPGQPPFREIEEAAKEEGIVTVYQPIVSGGMTSADVEAFAKSMEKLPKPVLAYCRSGTRCTALWALSEAGKRPVDEILERTRKAGYDMSPLLGQLG